MADCAPRLLSQRTLAADRGDAGVRLDRVLQRHLADVPGMSRTRVQHWIAAGAVRVGERVVRRVSARVAHGDTVTVLFAAPAPRARPQPEAGALSVLYEDEDVLVLDKPPHLVVHPSYKHPGGTVLNALLGRSRDEGGGWTPRLVHRLDKQTSGVLVVARHPGAHERLVRAWHTRLVEKSYLAIVIGRPPKRRGEVRWRLARDPVDPRRVVASPTRGRESLTRYEVLAVSRGLRSGLALLRCELATGRMHQIRVHLASVGCPIAGDRVYGERRSSAVTDPRLLSAVAAMPRHALHAWRIQVRERALGPALSFVAPLPADMRQLLDAAGIDVETVLAGR